MTSAINNKPVKKKKRAASLDRKKSRAGWVFAAPFLIGFLLIYIPILFDSIKSTFFQTHSITGSTFVGFQHYMDALFGYVSNDKTFITILGEALAQLAIDIPSILIFSLFMAVLLNQKMAGRGIFRSIFFIPVILSTGIMETIEASNNMGEYMGGDGINTGAEEGATEGFVNMMDIQILFSNLIGVGDGLLTLITDIINNIFNIVNRSGVQMLIFLSGLQSISPAIYESCQIDGASSWETFWKITFPMISPMILVNAVYTVIDSFMSESNVAMSFIDGVANSSMAKEVSVAMYWMYFLVVILVLAAITALISAFVFYQRKD